VIVTVFPAVTVLELTVTIEFAAVEAPGVTVIVGGAEVIGEPPNVAVTVVAVPAVEPVKTEV
jgi:hypothetical protein